MLTVRFWGVRGSIPCPGKETIIYGGNTACLEIRADERLIIIDLGTGVRPLGRWLMKNDLIKNEQIEADIFITHTHWDHIMGFPVFSPLFVPSTKLRIQGPVTYESDTLESILRNQLSYRYWPVRLDELAADISYRSIRETTQDLGRGLKVTAKYLNHPILCLGYRFEYQDRSIVTAYDHEPFRNIFPTDPKESGYDEDVAREGELAAEAENNKMFAFFKDAGILIHDCQYTTEEYEAHLGWGHSSYEHTLKTAQEAGIKKLVFFHHEPSRTDEELAALEKHYQKEAEGSGMEVIMAREGMFLEA